MGPARLLYLLFCVHQLLSVERDPSKAHEKKGTVSPSQNQGKGDRTTKVNHFQAVHSSVFFHIAMTWGMAMNVSVFSGFSRVNTSSAHAITLPEKLEGGPQYTSTCSLIRCSEMNLEIINTHLLVLFSWINAWMESWEFKVMDHVFIYLSPL